MTNTQVVMEWNIMPAPTKAAAFDAWFESFWQAWPRKIAKSEARKAALRKMTTDERRQQAVDRLQFDLPELLSREPHYRPHLSTWMNQERWADPIEQDPEPVVQRKRSAIEEAMDRI